MKLNKKLIKQLRNGEIAVENSGTVEQLRGVLKAVFPKDRLVADGTSSYYYLSTGHPYLSTGRPLTKWDWGKTTNLPTFKISDFYQPELFTGWAKDDKFPNWMGYFKDDVLVYRFNLYGKFEDYYNNSARYSSDVDNRPATHEEIESTLISEAKSRGYKGGNTIKGIHGTLHFPEEISFHYEVENNRLETDEACVVFENGQWAEIIEQTSQPKPKTNPIKYIVDGIEYSLDYQELKAEYDNVVAYSDEGFMANLPQIAHLACVVAYLKGLGVQVTISDKGIIHELIHLMTSPEEPTNDLAEIREKFNRLIQLV